MMDIDEIKAILPHRHPFLMVDRLLELDPGNRAVGIKQVTATEPWVPGHFPGNPILPGVLVAEALAQVAAVIFLTENVEHADGRALYLVGLDGMRFRKPVRPGDTLKLDVTALNKRRRMWTFSAVATVDDVKVANGTLLATVATG
jgi:3-hydroxyacyl-[acyl-carrier-protein] dehydratase